jgi:hypothetical protein
MESEDSMLNYERQMIAESCDAQYSRHVRLAAINAEIAILRSRANAVGKLISKAVDSIKGR